MGKVHLSGYLEVPADRLDAVRAALPDHLALTRAEPGCLLFSVKENPTLADRFEVAETFADEAAFEQHQHRAKASAWAAVTEGLARHYTIRVED
jgi:quinol monooxygenase YgiN